MRVTRNLGLSAIFSVAFALTGSMCQAQRYTYNASAAASYAKIYYKNYNSLFANFASSGGDCANFADQCVVAGLIGNSSGATVASNASRFSADKGSPYSWYYINGNNHSTSWTYAPTLLQYAKSNKPSYKGLHFQFITEDSWTAYLNVNSVQVGDIIFADWTNDGTMDHVMIVTEIQTSQAGYNKIRVASHTTDMANSGLGDINVLYRSRATFHVYRPTDYNFSGQ